MSQQPIRAALETALASISSGVLTAWENVEFSSPDQDTAFQQAFTLFAEPLNLEFGAGYQEQGFFQINLNYPIGGGTANQASRVEVLRQLFSRGSSFPFAGGNVTIIKTPEVMPGRNQDGRWVVVVRIRFLSSLFA